MSVQGSTRDNPTGDSLLALALAAAAALLVFIHPAQGSATVVTYADLPDLVELSDVVIRGEVTRRESHFDPAQGRLVTHTTFKVDRRYMGETDETVTIEQWGGTNGETTSTIPGDADFTVGQEVVVFLRYGPENGLYLTALAQSKFSVHRTGQTPLVSRNLSKLVFLEESADGQADRGATFHIDRETRRLDSFEAELRSLIYARRGGSQ